MLKFGWFARRTFNLFQYYPIYILPDFPEACNYTIDGTNLWTFGSGCCVTEAVVKRHPGLYPTVISTATGQITRPITSDIPHKLW